MYFSFVCVLIQRIVQLTVNYYCSGDNCSFIATSNITKVYLIFTLLLILLAICVFFLYLSVYFPAGTTKDASKALYCSSTNVSCF